MSNFFPSTPKYHPCIATSPFQALPTHTLTPTRARDSLGMIVPKVRNDLYPRPHYVVQATYRVTALNRHGAGRPGGLSDGISSLSSKPPPSAESSHMGLGYKWRTVAVFLRNEDVRPAHLLSKDGIMASLESSNQKDVNCAEGERKPTSAPTLAVQAHPNSSLFPDSIHDRSPVYVAEKHRLEEEVDALTEEQEWLEALAGPPEKQAPSLFATFIMKDPDSMTSTTNTSMSIDIKPQFRDVKDDGANLRREVDETLHLEEHYARLDSLGKSPHDIGK